MLFNEGGGNLVFNSAKVFPEFSGALENPTNNFWSSDGVYFDGTMGVHLTEATDWYYPHITIAFRFKTNFSTYGCIAFCGSQWSTETFEVFATDTKRLRFYARDAGGATLLDATGLTSNQIYSAACVIDGTKRTIYLDGKQAAQDNKGVLVYPSTLPKMGVGIHPFNAWGGGTTQPYTGYLDYIYFYNRALTAAEIVQLHADPYCFVQPVRPRVYLADSPVVPVVTGEHLVMGNYMHFHSARRFFKVIDGPIIQ